MVEYGPILSAIKNVDQRIVSDISLAIFVIVEVTENDCVIERLLRDIDAISVLFTSFLQRVRIASNAERCTMRDSVCLSVTFRYCVQMNEDTIVPFSASGRTIPLVSGEAKFIRIFAGDHPGDPPPGTPSSIDSENSTNSRS